MGNEMSTMSTQDVNNKTEMSPGAARAFKTLQSVYNSKLCPECNDLVDAKQGGAITGGCPFMGGCVKMYGGGTVTGYPGSTYSRVKEALIRKVAQVINRNIKTNINTNGSIGDIVKELEKILPDPKSKKTINKKVSESVCIGVAKSFNEVYGDKVIDVDAKIGDICEQTSELLQTMTHGFQLEFLETSKAIKHILDNLNKLNEFLDAAENKIVADVEKSDDETLKSNVAVTRGVYNAVKTEVTRQLTMLANLIDKTIDPVEADLAKVMRKTEDFHDLVRKIKDTPGTSDFSDKVAYMLRGFTGVTQAAERVDDALKTIGVKLSQYKNADTVESLKRLVYGKSGTVSAKDIELLEEVLYKYAPMHDEIIAVLEKRHGTKGSDEFYEGGIITTVPMGGGESDAKFDEEAGYVEGGADYDEYDEYDYIEGGADVRTETTRLDRRIRVMERVKERLLKDFRKSFERQVIALVASVTDSINELSELSAHDESFVRFLDSLKPLQNINTENIGQAVLGYSETAYGIAQRDRLLRDLDAIRKAAEPFKKGETKKVFERIERNIDEIVETINIYTKALKEAMTLSYRKTGDGIDGGAEGGAKAIDENINNDIGRTPFVDPRVLDIEQAIKGIKSQYRKKLFRENLKRVAKEIGNYQDDYIKLLGETIGSKIETVQREYGVGRRDATALTNDPAFAGNLTLVSDGIKTDPASVEEYRGHVTKFLNNERDYRVELYRVVESIDLFLAKFTKELTAHPEDVSDLAKILDGTDIIAKWFTENSGDELALLFERFPFGYSTNGTGTPKAELSNIDKIDGRHYYEKVAEALKTGDGARLPGNPYIGISPVSYEGLDKTIGQIIDNFTALKNIISMFSNMARRIGGVNIDAAIPLRPIQIYRRLVGYVQRSALGMGFGPNVTTVIDNTIGDIGNAIAKSDAVGNAPNVPILNAGVGVINPNPVRKQTFIGMRGVATGTYPLAAVGALDNNIKREWFGTQEQYTDDRWFVAAMKAIVAKIYTVIGTYSILKKRDADQDIATNPVRIRVLGAAEGGEDGGYDPRPTPAVKPELYKLYLQLTLLAEWYREVFEFKSDDAGYTTFKNIRSKVTMIPDLTGKFGQFIQFIFDTAKDVSEGNYSDTYVKELVYIINELYAGFGERNAESRIEEIIDAFIDEMNRRWGIVSQEAVKKYEAELAKRRAGTYTEIGTDVNRTNYSILPDEDEESAGTRPSPSDRYVGRIETQTIDPRYKFDDARAIVDKFIERVDDSYKGIDADEDKRDAMIINFSNTVNQHMESMRKASDNETRFKVLVKALQGANKIAALDVNKAMMYHEFVLTPLTVLNEAIYAAEFFRNITYLLAKFINSPGFIAWHNVVTAATVGLAPAAATNVFTYASNVLRAATGAASRAEIAAPGTGVTGGVTKAGKVRVPAPALQGIAGVITGATLGPMLQEFINTNIAFDQTGRINTLMEYADTLNWSSVVESLFNALFAFDGERDALVEVRFADGHVAIDYGKLQMVCSETLDRVKRALDQFRNVVPTEVLNEVVNPKKYGSVYDLERRINDFLFGNRDGLGLQNAIDNLDKIFDFTFKYYANNVARSIHALFTATQQHLSPGGNRPVDRVFKYITDSDFLKGQGIILVGGIVPPSFVWPQNLSWTDFDKFSGPTKTKQCDLVTAFNELLAKYILAFFNEGTGTIYTGFLQGIVNGPLSKYIGPDHTEKPHMDFTDGAKSTLTMYIDQNGDAKPILTGSLAILLHILSNMSITQVGGVSITKQPKFTDQSLTKVSYVMRNAYKTHIPQFVNAVDSIIRRCEFASGILDMVTNKRFVKSIDTGVVPIGHNQQTPIVAAGADFAAVYGKFTANKADVAAAPIAFSALRKGYETIIREITNGALSIRSCLTSVAKEIADNPIFFEHTDGFIDVYKSRFGSLPTMPISLIARPFFNSSILIDTDQTGGESFTYRTGLRAITSPLTKFTVESMPYMRELVKTYNSIVDKSYAIDTELATGILDNVYILTNYAYARNAYKRYLYAINIVRGETYPLLYAPDAPIVNQIRLRYDVIEKSRTIVPFELFDVNEPIAAGTIASAADAIENKGRNLCEIYTCKRVSELVAFIESSRRNKQLEMIRDYVQINADTATTKDRKYLRVLNLIDLNRVPINLNALMRSIALANIIVYETAFDAFVRNTLEVKAFDKRTTPDTPTNMLYKLLTEPHARIFNNIIIESNSIDYLTLSRLFRGDHGVTDLGVPRYLSDQLYSKVLLQSLYSKYAGNVGNPNPIVPSPAIDLRVIPGEPIESIATSRVFNVPLVYRYIDKADKNIVKVVQPDLTGLDINLLIKMNSTLRFDTILVRNLMFIANLQRIIRLELRKKMSMFGKIVRGRELADRKVTEYAGNEMYPLPFDETQTQI